MIDITVTTAGSRLLSVDEAKDFLRLSGDDPELTLLMDAIQEKAEAYCGRSFTAKTLQLRMDRLDGSDTVILPRYPVISITSVATLDEDDASTAIASSTYYLADQQRLVFTTVPDIERDFGGLLITYVSGAKAQVPGSIKAGMLRALSTVYENREDYVIGSTIASLPDMSKTFFDTWRDLC